jgi:DNA-binding PadR family transcriptional regulator
MRISVTYPSSDRQMLTKNDLLVLGLLLDRPMHGYEISQYVKSEGVTTWFDISTAAIYYSLNKLRRQGLISDTRSRTGGEKSVYHVTELGRERFFAGMEKSLASEEPVRLEYDLNIFLLNRLPQSRALELLERRWEFLSRRLETLEEALENERLSGEPLRVAILEHSVASTSVERQWLGGIIQHLQGDTAAGEEYRGLMLLSGDLRDFHLPDLIKLIASGEHSGTLTVADATATRTLSFHEGRPVCATSSQRDVEVSERHRILNDIFDLFRWQEGTFTLDQRMGPQEGCSVLNMSTADLILAGTRWVDNWSTIQQVVPSPDAVFEARDEGVPSDELDLTETERRVLDALDGLSDVSDVAHSCALTEFETSKIIYGLCTVGLVQPGDLGKVRLRRVFREFAELMCQGTLPYREAPDDFTCEREVNQQCKDVPIRFIAGRIEDQTNPALRTQDLAEAYRAFLQAQNRVVRQRFGTDVARTLVQQVMSRISPGLRDALEEYDLVAFSQNS